MRNWKRKRVFTMRAFDEQMPVVVNTADGNTELALENSATEEMIAEMRRRVDAKNKAISVFIDEKKGESAKKLSENLAKLDKGILDEETIERVQKNITTPKDLLDYAKATESIYGRIIKQSRESADAEKAPPSSREIKIGLAFADGTSAMPRETQIVISEGENG